MWEILLPTIVGGCIGLLGSFVGIFYQSKHDKRTKHYELQLYLFEKREPLYLQLAGALNAVHVCINGITGTVNVEELEKQLQNLNQVVEANQDAVAYYLPLEIGNELMKLNAEIYAILSNEDKQEIDLSALKESEIWKVTEHAKKLLFTIRKEANLLSLQ